MQGETQRPSRETHKGFWISMDEEVFNSYSPDEQIELKRIFNGLAEKSLKRFMITLSKSYGTQGEESDEKKHYDVDPSKLDEKTFETLTKLLKNIKKELQENAIEMFRLERKSNYDNLTGLLQRDAFAIRCEQEIERLFHTEDTDNNTAILFVDLDDFKRVNTEHGHAGGDELLKSIGKKLKNILRPLDVACRHGGDEITIMMKHIPEKDINVAVCRILSELNSIPIAEDSKETLSVSVGVRIIKPGIKEVSLEEVLSEADTASYATKQSGKNGVTIITSKYKDKGLTATIYEIDRTGETARLVVRNDQENITLQKS